jgi:hypothetical protein
MIMAWTRGLWQSLDGELWRVANRQPGIAVALHRFMPTPLNANVSE